MGILINTGFDVGSSNPIDSRTVKNTIEERDKLVTDGLAYESLKTYVLDEKKWYEYDGSQWNEIQTGNDYSTTEQAVGTWIDGSTIYRKVFIIDNVAAQTTEADVKICDVGINLQNRIINISGAVNSIGNDGLLPYAYYPNIFQFFSYLKSSSVYFKGTWKYPLSNIRIILEYKK